MKKIIALLLTFAFLFFCASCTENMTENPTETVTSVSDGILTDTTAQISAEETSLSETQAEISLTRTSRHTEKSTRERTTESTTVRFTKNETTSKSQSRITTTKKPTTTRKPKTTVRETTTVPTTTKKYTTVPETTEAAVKYCTVSISCVKALENKDKLKSGKEQFLPSDGYILHEVKMSFTQGETAFDILKRACAENVCTDGCTYCRSQGIQYEASFSAGYGNWYVEGIHQLYEKDCGSRSGWMYRVNGSFPNYGSSAYTVRDGDRIEWIYTCDLGEDIGA